MKAALFLYRATAFLMLIFQQWYSIRDIRMCSALSHSIRSRAAKLRRCLRCQKSMKKTLLFSLLLLVSGCTHLYKMYEYEGVDLESKFGTIGVSVSGTWNEISKEPEITELASPYTMRIGFVTPDEPGEKIMIKVISIGPSLEAVNYYKANENGRTKKSFAYKSESKSSWYAVVVSNIKPEHKPLTLKFELHYQGAIEYYEVVLKPKYWEEHRNNFYDGIMSV